MKKLSIPLLLFVPVFSASALTESRANEQLDIAPGGTLVVDVDFGTIDVSAGADGKVSVDAYRKIESTDEAREKEYVAAAPISVTKEGSTVTVRARRQGDNNRFGWHGDVNMDARYTIQVPKNFNVDLNTRGGTIAARDLTGSVKTNTSGGKLKFANLNGPLNGKTSGGSVDLTSCTGELRINTSGGQIDANGGSGNLDARTSGGSVTVVDFGGDTKVETSGGKLTLTNIAGKLIGRTSGGSIVASLASPVRGDVRLETSAGSIDVAVPPDAAFDVEAEASVGRVASELPFIGVSTGRDDLKGRINGGGKSMILRSGAGSITIKPTGPSTAAR